ncbi:hypothetical protein ACQJBY_038546 [Aegilops geniculata]
MNTYTLTFVSDEVLPLELSTNFTFGGTTYTLYSNSFLNFGQNAAQDSYREILKSRGFSHKRKVLARTSGASRSNLENQYVDNGSGNYKECRSSSLMMMQEGKERCEYQQCHLGSNFVPELLGHFLATENFYFTSKFFGLDRSSSLSDFVVAGEQLCNKDLSTLRQKYLNHSDEDFSRYCFSSAYIVALLHDSLGVPLDDKRIEYSNQVGDTHIEWALGAFIANTKHRILGASGAVATRSPKHRPLLAVLGAFLACGIYLVLRWRKPKTKIIYDLEKGRYIMTRIS